MAKKRITADSVVNLNDKDIRAAFKILGSVCDNGSELLRVGRGAVGILEAAPLRGDTMRHAAQATKAVVGAMEFAKDNGTPVLGRFMLEAMSAIAETGRDPRKVLAPILGGDEDPDGEDDSDE